MVPNLFVAARPGSEWNTPRGPEKSGDGSSGSSREKTIEKKGAASHTVNSYSIASTLRSRA